MTITHDTATQQTDQPDAWHPVRGEFLPWSQVYGYDPTAPVGVDDHAGPSEIDQLIADDQAACRDAFRARPAAVRRALTIRHRRAVRRARRHVRRSR